LNIFVVSIIGRTLAIFYFDVTTTVNK